MDGTDSVGPGTAHLRGRDRQLGIARLGTAAWLLLALLPFGALCLFAHPQNDDYAYWLRARTFGFAEANRFWYTTWTGRYLATAAISACPAFPGSWPFYKCAVAGLMALLPASAFAVTSAAFPEVPTSRRAAIALAFAGLFLFGMPNLVEGIYQLNSAVTYELGPVLLFLVAAIVLRMQRPDAREKLAGWVAAGSLLTIALAGTNEISGLHSIALLGAALLATRRTTGRVDRALLLLLLLAVLGFLANIRSAGSQARLASVDHHEIGFALKAALQKAGSYAWSWSIRTPALPVALLIASTLATLPRRTQLHPAWSLVGSVAIYLGSFFPSFYAAGVLETRTVDTIYWYWLAAIVLNAYLLCAHLADRRGHPILATTRAKAALAGLAITLTFLPDSNLRAATADLRSGAAARYDAEQNERYRMLEQCPKESCGVPAIASRPPTLFFFENAEEASDDDSLRSYKRSYAFYFGKDRIIVEDGRAAASLNDSFALYRAGRYAESAAAALRSLEIRPDSADAYNNLCAAYCSVGKWDLAVAACQKALELVPDYALARGNLAWAQQGQADMARRRER